MLGSSSIRSEYPNRVSSIEFKIMQKYNLTTFNDIGCYGNVLDSDIELHQLQKGEIHVKERSLNVGDKIGLFEKYVNKRVAITKDICFDKLRFGFSRYPEITSGVEIKPESLIYYKPGRNYPSILSDKFYSFDVNIDEEFFKSYNPELYEVINNYSNNSVCIDAASLVRPNIKALRQAIFVAEKDEGFFEIGAFQEFVMSKIEGIYSDYLGKDYSENIEIDNRFKNWDIFINMVEVIKSNPSYFNIESLAKDFSISSRTVLNIFKKFSGISPSQFIMAYRICLARTHLLNERRFEDPVTRAAVEAEFFHLGRFSHYYYSFFGENPSDTVFRLQKERKFIGNGK